MKRRVMRALQWTLVLASMVGSACSDSPPATASAPTTATVPLPAGTQGSAGAGAGATTPSAGATAAGSGADAGVRDAGTSGAGGTASAGRGGSAAVACRVPDNPAFAPDDADGGVDPTCVDVPRTIIAENCIGGFCHHSGRGPARMLDLMSPCVADRLLDARSSCQGLLLVDTKDVAKSFLLDKLENMMPTCGASMPDGWHLPPEQVRCVNAWVHAIVRQAGR